MTCVAVFFVAFGFESMGEAKVQGMDLPIQIVLLVTSQTLIIGMANFAVRSCLAFDPVRLCPIQPMVRRS